MALYDELGPTGDDNYLTSAKYIQGGYFVVAEKADLSKLKVAEDGLGVPYGTIVPGSLCYCQLEGKFYFCKSISEQGDATWVEANVLGTSIQIDVGDDGYVGGAATEVATPGLSYEALNNGTYAVWCKDSGVKNSLTNLIIPSTHQGKPVTQIRAPRDTSIHAFEECPNLVSVTIPSGITFIDEKAFYKCKKLKSVTIPHGVTDIGSNGGYVFEYCESLEFVSIPASVKIMGPCIFNNCPKVEVYLRGMPSVPDGWVGSWNRQEGVSEDGHPVHYNAPEVSQGGTAVYAGAEYRASNGLLLSVNADGEWSVSGIGSCTDTEIRIPSTHYGVPVTSISAEAFKGCTSIKKVILSENVRTVQASAFKDCTGLKRVAISDTVISIEHEAFKGCTNLEAVTIPKSVQTMGKNVFRDCPNLVVYVWFSIADEPVGWPKAMKKDGSFITEDSWLGGDLDRYTTQVYWLCDTSSIIDINRLHSLALRIYNLEKKLNAFHGITN
ncbi:MAG: leucine-rich repeat domain-containing protein [Kiritimatiellae bacterium]|nr:leucine-rich repeat domain-containing protein [Kiritimatiellia bacterium]